MTGVVTGLRDLAGALFSGEVEIGVGLSLTQNAVGKTVLSRPGSGNYVFTDAPWNGRAQAGFNNDAAWALILAAIPPGDVIFFPPADPSVAPNGYEFSATQVINKSISLRSELQYGSYGDWLSYIGTGTAFQVRAQGVQFDGLGIKSGLGGATMGAGLIAIDAMDPVAGALCAFLEINHCSFVGFAQRCLKTNAFFVKIHDTSFQGKTGGTGAFVESYQNGNAFDVNNIRCVFTSTDLYTVFDLNTGFATHNGLSTGSELHNVWVDNMPVGVTAIRLRGGCYGWRIINFRMEADGGTALGIDVDLNAHGNTISGGTMGGSTALPCDAIIRNYGGGTIVSGVTFIDALVGLKNEAGARNTTVMGLRGVNCPALYTDASGEGFTAINSDPYPGLAVNARNAPVRLAASTALYPSIIITPSTAPPTTPTEGMGWWLGNGGDLDGLYFKGPATGLGAGLQGPIRGGPNSHGVFKSIELMGSQNQLHMRSGPTLGYAQVEFFRDPVDQFLYAGSIGFPSANFAETHMHVMNALGELRFGSSGAWRWVLEANPGHFRPAIHNAVDIGTTAIRVKDLWLQGNVECTSVKVGGNQVVGGRQAAVADATDAASAITQLNALLARLRTHGLIAP